MNGKGSVFIARNVEIFITLVFELIFITLYIQALLIGDITRLPLAPDLHHSYTGTVCL